MPLPILAAALLPAAYQGIQGIRQHRLAKRLKESTFVPQELLMNQNLAQQQAYSRRSPGQAFAEEQVRRGTANQIGAAQRSFGGDANKVAAITSAATAGGNDANSRLAAQGAQFSEAAFNRLQGANNAVAGQKRQNRDEYNRAKADLIAAGDQNIFNAVSNIATAGVTGLMNKQEKQGGGGIATPEQVGMFNSGGAGAGYMGSNPWNNWINGQLGYPGMNMNYDPSVWLKPWGRGTSQTQSSYLKNQ